LRLPLGRQILDKVDHLRHQHIHVAEVLERPRGCHQGEYLAV
jgi:hypothetical protein